MATASPHVTLPEIRERLRAFDFAGLFNELGWDYLRTAFPVDLDDATYTVQGIAEKRGVQIFRCAPGPDGKIPDASIRRRIDRKVTQQAREHLLVFTDGEEASQIWRWELSEPGRPLRAFEYEFSRDAREEQVAQILRQLFVSIDQEERPGFSIVDVTRQLRGAFEAEQVTRTFYRQFEVEHSAFREFIEGIPREDDLDWYASLMLNRLMFIYFIQEKSFLDGDDDYLRNKLAEVRRDRGDNQFHSFYRHFLRRLFHEGLSQEEAERTSELDALLGRVPYLNGGLFDVHTLERAYDDIEVPDKAFERLFDFFDDWRWHLDERPLRNDREINPDVLGYIFEKYINQKQMGAYYSKEDITGYIARNTIIPRLFDMAREDVRIAFAPNSALWRLLQEDPDRYIYPAMQHGMSIALPAEIEAGRSDVARRGGWNRAAPAAYALPTETWREHVGRRERYEAVWFKLADGEVNDIDALITLNLDIHQFAVDAITECEGSETLRAFWDAIQRISVLDPTCGSGAFLFAALNILQLLAEACLERMQSFVDELDRSDVKHRPERFRPFREALSDAASHHNREYYVLKQIILNNLYGVDIMEEAVEICKLRLFLKLVAQIDDAKHIEPLPDIDFNIRAGNTLVGFASFDSVDTSLRISGPGQLQMMEIIESTAPAALQRIDEEAEKSAKAFQYFRTLQNEGDDAPAQRAAKEEVRARLATLREELDRLQARVYAIEPDGPDYEDWRGRHEPFHWVTEFYDIIHNRGGFDVIIGNPPWAEYSTVRRVYQVRGYLTERCGNLYAFCSERSLELLGPDGRFSFIVQLPITSSPRMQPIRELLDQRTLHISTFDDRPGKLFDGLQNCRSAIFISSPKRTRNENTRWTTVYQRWPTVRRDMLFNTLEHARLESVPAPGSVWQKVGSAVHGRVLEKVLQASRKPLESVALGRRTEFFMFYQESARYWIKAAAHVPYYARNGDSAPPAHGRFVYFPDQSLANVASSVLNSSLFYALFVASSDCFHVNDSMVRSIPVTTEMLQDPALCALNERLMADLRANATITTIATRGGVQISYAEYVASESKSIIDEIDRVLASHYGLTNEELDFVLNYDVKFRMGADGEDEAA